MSNRTNPHRNPCPERTATIRWLSVTLAAAGLWMSIGCDGAQKLAFREKFKHYTPQQNYDILLHDTDADARRRAAVRIGDGPFALEDAFAVLDTTARTDANGQVRCAAIRVLAKYQDGRPVPTMLAILNPQAHPDEATPAPEPVRWDATLALAGFCEGQLVPGQHADEVREVLISLLLNDNDRNVRMAATRGLGTIRDARVLRPLVAQLRHRDFGIAYEAERSLYRLTGQPLQYDADAWTAWLDATSDPFDPTANAPQPPAPDSPTG